MRRTQNQPTQDLDLAHVEKGTDLFYLPQETEVVRIPNEYLVQLGDELGLTQGQVEALQKLNLEVQFIGPRAHMDTQTPLSARSIDAFAKELNENLNSWGENYRPQYRSILGQLGGRVVVLTSSVEGELTDVAYSIMYPIGAEFDSEGHVRTDIHHYIADTNRAADWPGVAETVTQLLDTPVEVNNMYTQWDYSSLESHRGTGLGRLALKFAMENALPPEGILVGFIEPTNYSSMFAALHAGRTFIGSKVSPYAEDEGKDMRELISVSSSSFERTFTGEVVASYGEAKSDPEGFAARLFKIVDGGRMVGYDQASRTYQIVSIDTSRFALINGH